MPTPAHAEPAASAHAPPWQDLRDPPSDRDRALNEQVGRWLRTLPGRFRPRALCAQFPRITNRIALCWNDPVLTQMLLDQLLVDHRGGRKGFPPDVAEDLSVIVGLHARRMQPDAAAGRWERLPPSDR